MAINTASKGVMRMAVMLHCMGECNAVFTQVPGHALKEVFGDERHEWRHYSQTAVQYFIQHSLLAFVFVLTSKKPLGLEDACMRASTHDSEWLMCNSKH